jgi:hypothetical protein
MHTLATPPGAAETSPGAFIALRPTSWRNTLIAGSLLLAIGLAWVQR